VRSTTKQLIPGRKSQEVKGWDGGESGLGGGRAIVVINVLRLRLRIDVPDIRIMIYIRFIWNLKLRADKPGRDGGRSEAIIILSVRDGQQVKSLMRTRGDRLISRSLLG